VADVRVIPDIKGRRRKGIEELKGEVSSKQGIVVPYKLLSPVAEGHKGKS